MNQKILAAGMIVLTVLILGCTKPYGAGTGTTISLNGTGVEGLFQENNISTDGLKLIQVKNETLNNDNFTHVRVQEYVDGIAISGDIIYHFKNGKYYFLSGERTAWSGKETQPKVSSQQAFDTACQISMAHADGSKSSCNYPRREVSCSQFVIEKIYWRTGPGDAVLAWEIKYNDSETRKTPYMIVDALDGKILYDAPWVICD